MEEGTSPAEVSDPAELREHPELTGKSDTKSNRSELTQMAGAVRKSRGAIL